MSLTFPTRRRTPEEFLAGGARFTLGIYRKQGHTYRYARVVERNMDRPHCDLKTEADSALASIVNHAYTNSPFYRRRFDSVNFTLGAVKCSSDLVYLPEVSKLELAENIDEICCAPKHQLHQSQTGGTTGIGLKFYRDSRCLAFRRGIDLATTRYYGWRDGQWQGWLWGAAADAVNPKRLPALIAQRFCDRMYYVDAMNLSEKSYQRFSDLTRRYQPTYVSAYPTVAYDMAMHIERGEVTPFHVPMVCLTAEPVYGFQKAKIREMFADAVLERYASRETGTTGLECPCRQGLHYFTESVVYEVSGTKDEGLGTSLLVTDLLNYGMPLIRYHTGDFGEIDESPCACGRSTPRLRNLRGRETDMIRCPDGHGVAGFMVASLVGRHEIHTPVQIVQDRRNHIYIRIQGTPGEWQNQLAELIETFRNEISKDIQYEVTWVKRIERTPSGKFQYVISKVSSL